MKYVLGDKSIGFNNIIIYSTSQFLWWLGFGRYEMVGVKFIL